jgi:hypothetical protein
VTGMPTMVVLALFLAAETLPSRILRGRVGSLSTVVKGSATAIRGPP